MTCSNPLPVYPNPALKGLVYAGFLGDGYTVQLAWAMAVTDRPSLTLVYNIYYSSIEADIFSEGVKFVVIDPQQTKAKLTGFTPGDTYYFAVRATLYDPAYSNYSQLQDAPSGLKIYPESPLTTDITADDLIIPVMDINLFPPTGIVLIGRELIRYANLDIVGSNLVVASAGRGFYSTEARPHTTDGYDGYATYDNIFVDYFAGFDDHNISIVMAFNKFDYPNYARTDADGYAEVVAGTHTDLVVTQMDASDEAQVDFRPFDFAGYRRTDPVDLLAGDCVGSYYGGEYYCADGYNGVGQQVRGLSISEVNNQRQEVLLSVDAEPVVLVKRIWTGKRCKCYDILKESPESRCPRCYGTGFSTGYNQYFNPRRSDGRIMVRFDPTVEDLIPQESGLESDFKPLGWTLVVPAIRDRDFLIRFNLDGSEEFRYEILNVTRNKFLLNDFGAQKLSLARIRKTDPIYMWRAIRDTSTMPTQLSTSIGMVPGPGGIPPHVHNIVINENILSISQINQTTDIAQGHNHPIINGQIVEILGHSHEIILP